MSSSSSSDGNSVLPESSSSSSTEGNSDIASLILEDLKLSVPEMPNLYNPLVEIGGDPWAAYKVRNMSKEEIARTAKTEVGVENVVRFFNGTKSKREKDYVVQAMLADVYGMIIDEYGSLTLMKIAETADNVQTVAIIKNLVEDGLSLAYVACHFNGSKVLQVMIKKHKRLWRAMKLLTDTLAPFFCLLMSHGRGRAIIRDCFMYLDEHTTESLFKEIRLCCLIVGQHERGRTLRQCISYMGGERGDAILHIIFEASLCLATDYSGSYLVQQVLDMLHPVYTPAIVEKLIRSTRLVEIATDRYGSLVVREALCVITITQDKCVELYGLLRMILGTYYKDYLKNHQYGKRVYRVIEAMEKYNLKTPPIRGSYFRILY